MSLFKKVQISKLQRYYLFFRSPPNQVLIPGTLNVTLFGRRAFGDVIKLRTWKWGDYPGLSWWTKYNLKDPYKGKKAKGQRKRYGYKSRIWRDTIVGFLRQKEGMSREM